MQSICLFAVVFLPTTTSYQTSSSDYEQNSRSIDESSYPSYEHIDEISPTVVISIRNSKHAAYSLLPLSPNLSHQRSQSPKQTKIPKMSQKNNSNPITSPPLSNIRKSLIKSPKLTTISIIKFIPRPSSRSTRLPTKLTLQPTPQSTKPKSIVQPRPSLLSSILSVQTLLQNYTSSVQSAQQQVLNYAKSNTQLISLMMTTVGTDMGFIANALTVIENGWNSLEQFEISERSEKAMPTKMSTVIVKYTLAISEALLAMASYIEAEIALMTDNAEMSLNSEIKSNANLIIRLVSNETAYLAQSLSESSYQSKLFSMDMACNNDSKNCRTNLKQISTKFQNLISQLPNFGNIANTLIITLNALSAI